MNTVEAKPNKNMFYKAYVCAAHPTFIDRSNQVGRWKKIEGAHKSIEKYRNIYLPSHDVINGYVIYRTENRKIVDVVEVYGTTVVYDDKLKELAKNFITANAIPAKIY